MKFSYLIWFPGYAFLFLTYLLPWEWGIRRNVATTSRLWEFRDILAPVFSILFYAGIGWILSYPENRAFLTGFWFAMWGD